MTNYSHLHARNNNTLRMHRRPMRRIVEQPTALDKFNAWCDKYFHWALLAVCVGVLAGNAFCHWVGIIVNA